MKKRIFTNCVLELNGRFIEGKIEQSLLTYWKMIISCGSSSFAETGASSSEPCNCSLINLTKMSNSKAISGGTKVLNCKITSKPSSNLFN